MADVFFDTVKHGSTSERGSRSAEPGDDRATWKIIMESTSSTISQDVVRSRDEDILYEVVDGHMVELAPMGAYEVWLATALTESLRSFARQHHLGRAVQEMLFDL